MNAHFMQITNVMPTDLVTLINVIGKFYFSCVTDKNKTGLYICSDCTFGI